MIGQKCFSRELSIGAGGVILSAALRVAGRGGLGGNGSDISFASSGSQSLLEARISRSR